MVICLERGADLHMSQPGAALARGGVQKSGPPATAKTTCEIRLNLRTFCVVRERAVGVSDNAVPNIYTVSQKRIPGVFSCNSSKHCLIFKYIFLARKLTRD